MSSEDNVQIVIETIDSTISARFQLSHLLDGVSEAKNQVLTSAAQAKSRLTAHFECLRQCVNEALSERLAGLQQSVDNVVQESIAPLEQCQQEIQHRVDIAVQILDTGKSLLEREDVDGGLSRESVMQFKNDSKRLNLNNLPQVPSLWDTACVCVDLPRDDKHIRHQLVEAVRDYGRVLSRAPVQISDISERPAALLVHWAETSSLMDDANVVSGEFDVYRLQLCRGKVSALDSESMTSSFSDVYEGPNTSHLVTNLDHNVQYSVRVSGQSYSESVGASWSPWSLPVTWFTSLPRRVWSSDSVGCELTNDRRTVQRTLTDTGTGSDTDSDSVVCMSSSASVQSDHSVSFHLHHIDTTSAAEAGQLTLSERDGVGLSLSDDVNVDSDDVIFYSFHGGVYADRQLKTTRLPTSLESGRVITFETELVGVNKLRVTVEVCDKVITFDWNLPSRAADPHADAAPLNLSGLGAVAGPAAQTDKVSLYFFTRLSSLAVSVTVD